MLIVRTATLAWFLGLFGGVAITAGYVMDEPMFGQWDLVAAGIGYGLGIVGLVADYRTLWPCKTKVEGGRD